MKYGILNNSGSSDWCNSMVCIWKENKKITHTRKGEFINGIYISKSN